MAQVEGTWRRQWRLQARIAGAGRTSTDPHRLVIDVHPRLDELAQGGGNLRISLGQPSWLRE